jgi:Rhodopirellula transposase.
LRHFDDPLISQSFESKSFISNNSKYNPIEHRLFCHITSACKGVVFSIIGVVKRFVDKTHTSTGLKVFSTIKDKVYTKGRKVSEKFKENMKIVFDEYLGKWNYTAIPTIKI